MTNTWNTKGIVLFYTPFKEADRLYTIYTELFGKQLLRAHGIKKIKAKLAGSLEPYAEVELFVIESKLINKIGGAVVKDAFRNIHNDIGRLNAAAFISEVVSNITKEDSPEPELYKLLYSTLSWQNHNSAQRTVLYSFVIKSARILGYDLAAQTKDVDTKKVILWLQTMSFEDVQKLRVNQEQWNKLLHVIQNWLYDHASGHIQAEKFLV
ncbi:MAG: DNA repair protein RecO [bacterium]|nr:DNA repair protein RecO [bacterium]